MLFTNTRYFSPVIMDGIPKLPKNSYEYREYWDEQDRRCREGYTHGGVKITGRHYHYLNFYRLNGATKERPVKHMMAPRFLDMDYEFYWELEKTMEARQNMCVFKRRQNGFSYKGAHNCVYNFTFVPDSSTVVCSGEEMYSKKTMGFVIDGLNLAAGTPLYRKRGIVDSADLMKASFVERVDGVDYVQGYQSELIRRTVSTPQSLVGLSPFFAMFEEAGKFKGVIDALLYLKPGLENAGIKTGTAFLIGTGGEENASVDELEHIFYNPDLYGMRSYDNTWHDDSNELIDDAPGDRKKVCYFMPGDYFTETTDDDGNSHREEARKIIHARREKLKHDKNSWLKEVTQYPLTPEEGFMIPDGNMFNAFLLKQQKARIMGSHSLQAQLRRGEIEWVIDGAGNIIGTDWKDYEHGRFWMTEPPVCDNKGKPLEGLYVAGTDSYDKDQGADPKRVSDGACRIHKLFNTISDTDDIPVCGVAERPPTAEEFFEDTAKMCVHYGWAMNLIEYSNILIGNWYLKNGFGRLLKERPEIAYATTINSKVQNRWGIDPNVKHHCMRMAADWVERNSHKILDVRLIDKLIRFNPERNDDEVDAFVYSIVHAMDVARIAVAPGSEKKFKQMRFVVRGGKMVHI